VKTKETNLIGVNDPQRRHLVKGRQRLTIDGLPVDQVVDSRTTADMIEGRGRL